MALILKVSFFTMLILLVHGQQQLQDGNTIDLLTFTRLLRTAARLAYPVTTRLNNVVGNLREIDAIPLLLNLIPNANPNNRGRNRPRSEFENLRRAKLPTRKLNSHDITGRFSDISPYDNYEDEYYAYDYYGDYEADDDMRGLLDPNPTDLNRNAVIFPPKTGKQRPAHVSNDRRAQTKPLHGRSGLNVPITNSNAAGNVLPESNNAQPKVIYVVVNPGDVKPGMTKDNTVILDKPGLKAIEDGVSNPADGVYIGPNVQLGIPNDPVGAFPNPQVNIKQAAIKPRVI